MMSAKVLMDAYAAKVVEAWDRDDFLGARVFESAENFVNEVMHGASAEVWVPRVVRFLVEREREASTREEREAFAEALTMVRAFES